jgi:UDP-glucose 4-epimerase
MPTARILVTGGAGFIGSHLCHHLLNHGQEVFIIDNLSNSDRSHLPPQANFYQQDLRERTPVATLIKKIKPTTLFHLAADAAENRSFFTPISAIENNINSYINTLVPCIKHGLKKVIFISSVGVYGHQHPPFAETTPRKPVDVYGIAKSTNEDLTRSLSQIHHLDHLIVRLHNVYGPGQRLSDPYRNAVAIFINAILSRKHIYIYGDGLQTRAFTYIDDCIRQLWLAHEMKQCLNQTFNLGSQEISTVNRVAHTLLRLFQTPLTTIHHLPARIGEVKHAYCNNSLLDQLTHSSCSTNLDHGLKQTYEYFKFQSPETPQYLPQLELDHPDTPDTWTKHLI